MIFVQAYHVMLIRMIFDGLIYFLVESLHKYAIRTLSSVLEHLVPRLHYPLGLIFGKGFIYEVFSDGITRKGDKFDARLTLDVGF